MIGVEDSDFTMNRRTMDDWHIESANGTIYLYKGLVEWMADDHKRRTYMRYYASCARGCTLVGGLGLGLLSDLCRSRLSDVTTVELDLGLIRLMGMDAQHGDAWEWAQRGGWDTIILDLWPDNAKPDEDLEELADRLRDINPGVTLIIHGYPELSDC